MHLAGCFSQSVISVPYCLFRYFKFILAFEDPSLCFFQVLLQFFYVVHRVTFNRISPHVRPLLCFLSRGDGQRVMAAVMDAPPGLRP